MQVRDYNGTGRWSRNAIIERYAEYAARLSVSEPVDLSPREHVDGNRRWIYPVMDKVIAGIKSGDAACIAIGAEFMEEDGKFVFGATLKSQVARSLRRSELSNAVKTRLRKRIVSMLLAGNTPREYREYIKLLRKIGFAEYWPKIEAEVPRSNKYALRYFSYLRAVHLKDPSVLRVDLISP